VVTVVTFFAMLLAAGIGTIAVTRYQRAGFDRTTEAFSTEVGVLADLQRALIEGNLPLGEIVYEAPGDGTLEQSWARWQELDETIQTLFEKAIGAADGSRLKALGRARSSYAGLAAGVSDAKELWGTGKMAAAMAAGSDPSVNTVWAPYLSAQRLLASLAVQTVDHLQEESSRAGRRQRIIDWSTVAALALGITACAASGWRMSKRVIRPLLTLRGAVTRIGTGRLQESVRVPASASSEIIELAEAVGTMAADLHRSQAHLRSEVVTDTLTGLTNRRGFDEQLQQVFVDGRERDAALLLLDLDDFKHVNDSFGHGAGDDLLVAVSRRLTAVVRPGDVVARLGGDEFGIIVRGDGDDVLCVATAIAERTLASIMQPVAIDGHALTTSLSVGVAGGHTALSPADLVLHADLAMYTAKRRGKGCFENFDQELHTSVAARGDLKRQLSQAPAAAS
jgi:diguanylate cyclase (GGDEF)-like protein